jgi:hypothetical protein
MGYHHQHAAALDLGLPAQVQHRCSSSRCMPSAARLAGSEAAHDTSRMVAVLHAVFDARVLCIEKVVCHGEDMQTCADRPGSTLSVSNGCASSAAPPTKLVAMGGALLTAGEPHFVASRVQSITPGPLWGAFK